MRIEAVEFHACSGDQVDGKRRPTAFEPYCVIADFPEIPEDLPYRTVARPHGTLYFREHEGSADFFIHDPRDEHGFGGAVFSGITEDGARFSAKGPWSSSCDTVNALGLPSEPLAHIAVRRPDQPHSWRARFVTLSILHQVAALVPDWRLEVPEARQGDERQASRGASDEQIRAIEGRAVAVPHFVPVHDFEDCPGCDGAGFVTGPSCTTCGGSGKHPRSVQYNCYDCCGRGFQTLPCAICARRFCASGIAPYPALNMGNRY